MTRILDVDYRVEAKRHYTRVFAVVRRSDARDEQPYVFFISLDENYVPQLGLTASMVSIFAVIIFVI